MRECPGSLRSFQNPSWYKTDDLVANREFANLATVPDDRLLAFRRIVMCAKDRRGVTKWTIDMNTAGNTPVSPKENRGPRQKRSTSTREGTLTFSANSLKLFGSESRSFLVWHYFPCLCFLLCAPQLPHSNLYLFRNPCSSHVWGSSMQHPS